MIWGDSSTQTSMGAMPITATLSGVSVKKLSKTDTSYRPWFVWFFIDTEQRIRFSFILELPTSFFKVVQDNLPRCKYLGKLFEFSWMSHMTQVSSSDMTSFTKKRWRKTNTELINYSLLTQWFITHSSIALKRVERQMFERKVFIKSTEENNSCSQKNSPAVTYTCTCVQHTDNKNWAQPEMSPVALIYLCLRFFLKFPTILLV